jgi:hypothetical protein
MPINVSMRLPLDQNGSIATLKRAASKDEIFTFRAILRNPEAQKPDRQPLLFREAEQLDSSQ